MTTRPLRDLLHITTLEDEFSFWFNGKEIEWSWDQDQECELFCVKGTYGFFTVGRGWGYDYQPHQEEEILAAVAAAIAPGRLHELKQALFFHFAENPS